MVKNLGCCWRTDQYSVLNTICPVGQLFPYRQYHIACPTTFTCIRHATADISNKCHFNKSTFKDSLWKRCSFINEFVENKIKQSIFCLFHLLIDNFPSSASRVLLNSSSGGESNQNHKQKTIYFFLFFIYTLQLEYLFTMSHITIFALASIIIIIDCVCSGHERVTIISVESLFAPTLFYFQCRIFFYVAEYRVSRNICFLL